MIKIAAVLLLVVNIAILAQNVAPLDPELGISTVRLYASLPDSATAPTLTVFKPHVGYGTGSAVIIAPGGAYLGLASNLEGAQVAEWFAARGFTAFVLKYRLGKENLFPIPLLDAQRAIRLVRSLSKEYKLSANRVGIIGFSAGGHLAAVAATAADSGLPGSEDPIDRLSARPDFLILGYPWLNATEPAPPGGISYCSVVQIPVGPCEELNKKYSPKLHVSKNTPPTFIYSTSEDGFIRSAVEFYDAMLAAGDPAEMHLFRHGAHGSGLGRGNAALDQWPSLLEQWLREQDLLTVDPTLAAAATRDRAVRGPGEPLTIDSPVEDIVLDKKASAAVDSICGPGFLEKLPKAATPYSLKKLAPVYNQQLSDANLAKIEAAFKTLSTPQKRP